MILAVCASAATTLEATPQLARQTGRDCSFCHLAPPVLNARGEDFLARGYRFAADTAPAASHERTLPVSVWNTLDYERRWDTTTNRAFPGRVEVISAGPIRSRASYFAEWRPVSLQIASGNSLLNRSGRFEDLFVTVPLGRAPLFVTAGQFRSIAQVDVSRRLSISEPQIFNASLPGKPAANSRETGLRAFSPSGRQPAIRIGWQQSRRDQVAIGWTALVTIPFPGELTIPFTDAASFEFDGRPKGVILESFWRSGVTSAGGHAFIGDDRWIAQAVTAFMLRRQVVLTTAAGIEDVGGARDGRYSLQGEWFVNSWLSAAGRVEDRTGSSRRSAGVFTLNLHLPFGPRTFRQALRFQLEQRVQKGDRRTVAALSHVF
jgi:hypothetical protein